MPVRDALFAYPRLYRRARQAQIVSRYLRRRAHEDDYKVVARLPDPGLFLDVGANAGTSALSFRTVQRGAPIISIEPNRLLEPELRLARRLAGNMTYHLIGAGAERGEFTLHTPSFRGVPLTGESSLSREAVLESPSLQEALGDRLDSPDFEISEQRVEVRPLDELGLAPRMIKIDVQGAEVDALRGLRQTIERHRPLLLVESAEVSNDDVVQFLRPLGYEPFMYRAGRDTLEAFADQAEQNLFLLAERDRDALLPR
jgi:FkbM family methyltransferase